ncbi:DUF1003 domain-containing protein [Patescibacteria group bacterium]|nr:DUF1003 domain-containing protein [Patescibacteria group bacterium]
MAQPRRRKKRPVAPMAAQSIRLFAQEMRGKRSFSERFADWLTTTFGTLSFLVFNICFFAVWILWNTGLLPGLEIFDPYPFGMLTLVVSLEAICLAVIVLMSQNRAAKVADIREELDFQIDTHSARQIDRMELMMMTLYKHVEKKNGGRAPEDDGDIDALEAEVMRGMEE